MTPGPRLDEWGRIDDVSIMDSFDTTNADAPHWGIRRSRSIG